jgi:hypothetical protein
VLGNLTLTTGELNSSISNGPWYAPQQKQDKSRALPSHSLLKLNTTVVRDYPQRFDERSVDERGALFAEAICEIWRGPDSATAPQAAAPAAAADGPATPEPPAEDADHDGARTRRRYPESIADLIAAGLLAEGAVLHPISPRYQAEAVVEADGSLRVGDEVVNAPSTAAQRVTGRVEPGWEFWGVVDDDGRLTSLFDLRKVCRLRAASRRGRKARAAVQVGRSTRLRSATSSTLAWSATVRRSSRCANASARWRRPSTRTGQCA